ncbi:MDR family MFS transporter [Streptomyces vinaceus]|uniref:MDR family MFS transporter n=1 Tax=Streptomyces vinaceus TaxID=1960 RepID=UPI003809F08E
MLFALVLIIFLGSLDSTILATALPTIATDLRDLRHLPWVVTSYLLGVTGSSLIWGKLGDLLGRKPVLQAALAVFLVGSILCSRAQNLPELVGFRALQGLGAGGIWVIPHAVLTTLVGPRERGRYQVYIAAAGASACVLGPLAGGILIEHGSWRWVFYLNVPLGLLVMAVLALCLRRERTSEQPRIDYWGSLLIASCTAAITLLVTWGGIFAWSSPPMLVLYGTTATLLILIWRVERSHPEPVLPARVVRERVFRIVVPLSFFFWVVQSGVVNYLPLFFQVVKGTSPTVSGLLLLPMSLSGLAAYTVSGVAISRSGRYRHFPIIGALLVLTGLGLCSALSEQASLLLYGAALMVMGLGFGLVSQIALIAAQSACAYRDIGVVTSGVVFFRNLGSAFGAALFGTVLNRRLVHHLTKGVEAGQFTASETARIHMAQPLAVGSMDSAARRTYVDGYELAVDEVFLAGSAMSLLVLALACFLPHVHLRGTMTEAVSNKDTPVIPSLPVGDEVVRTALADLAHEGLQPVRRRARELALHHGISLDAIWLLCIVSHSGVNNAGQIMETMGIPRRTLENLLQTLRSEQLLHETNRRFSCTRRGSELVTDLSIILRTQLDSLTAAGASGPPDLRAFTVEMLAEGSVLRSGPE